MHRSVITALVIAGALLAGRLAAPAAGPPPVGPDVIVVDIGAAADAFRAYGAIDGVAAFAASTTACNAGGADAEWIEGASGLHPVIAQHLYRLSGDGRRFEMIGMSWVKHTFCALSQPGCGDCPPGGDCASLVAGCADTYSAFHNGGTNLGPRRDIDPQGIVATHAHPFAAPRGSPFLAGRLQARTADLDEAGARFFIEAQYVARDEAPAARTNNTAWIEVSLPGPPGYVVPAPSAVGTARATSIALTAWQEHDPAVSIVAVDDGPDAGRFHVAYRVTDNGDGTWHYEYALHNLSSHRAARGFGVPAPVGVVVTGVEFHDVDYHSGDGAAGNYDGTDWPGVRASGTLTWSTDDEATDPNANALRWGTTYNVRFDADAPPAPAPATIDLYRAGSPDALAVPVVAPAAPPCPADLDDDAAVGFADVLAVLGGWGPCAACPIDLDGDGTVGFSDLLIVLGAWGPCPP